MNVVVIHIIDSRFCLAFYVDVYNILKIGLTTLNIVVLYKHFIFLLVTTPRVARDNFFVVISLNLLFCNLE